MGILERKIREKTTRKLTILQCARESFLENGMDAASLQDIAQRAELSKAAIYLYFKDKTDLLDELLAQTLEKLDGLQSETLPKPQNGLEELKSWGQAYTRLCLEFPDDFYFIQLIDIFSLPLNDLQKTDTEAGKLMNQFKVHIFSAFQKGIKDGSLRRDLDGKKSAVVISQVFSCFMRQLAALRDQVKTNTGYAPEELIDHLFEILIYAIAHKPGEKNE